MALITFVNILSRYCLHFSLAFTEEITIQLFVWLTMVGSGLAFERGGQLGMITLLNRLPCGARRGLLVFGALLSAALFLVIDLLVLRLMGREISLYHARSPALGLPVWIYYAGVPLGSLIVLRGIWRGARAAWLELPTKT